MKKPSNIEDINQPVLKLKMKVNLADEISNLLARHHSHDKQNISQQVDQSRGDKQHSKLLSTHNIQTSKQVCKDLSRSMSRLQLKAKSRLKRSDSQILRQPQMESKSVNNASKVNEFAYRSLLRNFEKIVKSSHAPRLLREQNIQRVLKGMGFLPNNLSAEDWALINTLRYMLCGKYKGVTHQNLLAFILVICNIDVQTHEISKGCQCQPATALSQQADKVSKPLVLIEIGEFDESGNWKTTAQDRKKIRRIFGKLYYNKISSEDSGANQQQSSQKLSFKPKILKQSRDMAVAHRAKILREAHQYCEVRPEHTDIDLAELLILNKKVNAQKLNLKLKEKEDKQQNQCTFQPKINKTTQNVKTDCSGNSSKDKCLELFEKHKQPRISKLEQRKPTSAQIQENELKQCTFKPTLTKYQTPKANLVHIKNQQKLIQRLKDGRQKRLLNQTIKNRGYPQNQNWNRFLKDFKRKTSVIIPNNSTEHQTVHKISIQPVIQNPILSMDIKLHEDTFQLQVFEGDSIQCLTCKILVRHQLPYERFSKVSELITSVISECRGISVLNGIVHQNTC